MKNAPHGQKTSVISSIYDAFLENESALKRFLRRFLYKSEDIDEISQETFLRAYKATQGREIDSPRAYLFQVARSLAYGELARNTRKLTDYLEEAVDSDNQHGDALEDELAAQQKIARYFDAIAQLPQQCRRVFLMRKVQAMTYKTIARELGISVSAVEQHIALGSRRCKHYLANMDDMPEGHNETEHNEMEQHEARAHERGQSANAAAGAVRPLRAQASKEVTHEPR